MIGKVYLIGAGPGDEGLLTVKASEILKKAEVLVYDRLVSQDILAKAPNNIEKINVGKNVGNHPVPQEEINKILLDKAMSGRIVVRLKGGDPFVFGRGGEELELLTENNIPFEVVPGITSAIAVAAYAGIPVTHRDFCSSLHIITGHTKKDGMLNIDYSSLVKLNGTLVFMMSVSTISEIANGLIKAGMDADMPIAVIENGTRAYQRKFVSTLFDIAKVIEENEVKSPAVIVVGKVCTLSDSFDWFSSLPLKGCRVLITRPFETSGKLASSLREMGGNVLEIPCIKTEKLNFEIDIKNYSWIVFTSAVGVNAFFEKLYEKGLDARFLYNKKIAVVGTATETELLKYGIRADFVPSVFDGKHLATELIKSNSITKNDNVILYRAKIGSDEILDILKENSINFLDVAVYETLFIKNKNINIDSFDFVCFTSASTVNGFINSFEDSVDFSKINAICIGEQTEKEAKGYGMNTFVSKIATIPSMVEKVLEVYNAK
jgi:uroporphyrinogen III methyltransferase/synthase